MSTNPLSLCISSRRATLSISPCCAQWESLAWLCACSREEITMIKEHIFLFQKYFFLEINSLFSSYLGPLFDRLAPIGEQIES